MLTPDEREELRVAARRYWPRGQRSRLVRFEGGPLDGMSVRLGESDLRAYSVGFATLTPTGPVQALYETGSDGRRVFARWVGTGGRAVPA